MSNMENNAFLEEEESLIQRISSGDDLVSLKDIVDDYIYFRKADFDKIDERDPLLDNIHDYFDINERRENTVIEENTESVEDKLSLLLGLNNHVEINDFDIPISIEEIDNSTSDKKANDIVPEVFSFDIDDVNETSLFNDLPNIQPLSEQVVTNIDESFSIDLNETIEVSNTSQINEVTKEEKIEKHVDLLDLENLFDSCLKEIIDYSVPIKSKHAEKKLESIKVPKEYTSKINEMLDKAFSMCHVLKEDLNNETRSSKLFNYDIDEKDLFCFKSDNDVLNDNLNIFDLV